MTSRPPSSARRAAARAAAALLLALASAVAAAGLALALLRPAVLHLLLGATVGTFEGVVQGVLALGAGLWLAIWRLARRRGARGWRAHGSALVLAALLLAMGATAAYERWSYARERVAFASDGHELVATVYRPRGAGPFPAVVLAPGSADLRREFMDVFADHLARRGMLVLNPDKRGTGESGGDRRDVDSGRDMAYLPTLLDVRARDMAAAVGAARRRPDVRPEAVGIFAISQGAWTAPLAAQRVPGLAFLVLVSAPAVTANEERVFSRLAGEDEDHFGYRPPRTPFAEIERVLDTTTRAGFDVTPHLERLRVPTLWAYGGWDKSVPAVRSAARVRALARAGAPFDVVLIPDANHGMMITRGPRKRPLAYFAPEFWPAVDRWLARRVGRPSP